VEALASPQADSLEEILQADQAAREFIRSKVQ
jgi:hypothetical protein